MQVDPAFSNHSPVFYAEIPGIHAGDGLPYQLKTDTFTSARHHCELLSNGNFYYYIVEARPELLRGDLLAMPNAVDAVRLSLFHPASCLGFPAPLTPVSSHITECPTIEDFVLNYRHPKKFNEGGDTFKWAIMYNHYYDILTKGYTHVSQHDNILGKFLTYIPTPETFLNIAAQFSETGLVRSQFKVSERITKSNPSTRRRAPSSPNGIKLK
ncbi:hypothetical protein ACQKLP_10675 [Chitinophaga sp. NPDC101104]|uniref:hypothetical protein n=1 Tax=Chitinophaga sp. NPDC101104 TaxID=3390561 RepID=UPI003CFD2ACD